MIAVETYSDLEGIGGLKDRWDRLWSLTPGADFSCSHDWYRAAAAAGEFAPRVYAANISGRMIGLWGMSVSRPGSRFHMSRPVACAGLDSASPCLVGPSSTATATIVARHLARTEPRGPVIFADVLPSGPLAAGFEAAGFSCFAEPWPPLLEVPLNGRWAEVRDCCDEETRLSVYRSQHASDEANYRFERLRPSGSGASASIREALGVSSALAATERRQIVATFEAAARRGAADVALLREGERVVAAALSFVTGGDLENHFAAVAPTAPRDAGTRLFVELFRDGIARGDRKFAYVGAADHPAAGWGKVVARRALVRAEAGAGTILRLRRVGRTLRRVAAGVN